MGPEAAKLDRAKHDNSWKKKFSPIIIHHQETLKTFYNADR